MTIRVRLGKLAVVAALAAAGTITTGAAAAHADDCHTSVTCGVSEDAGTYEPGSECPPKDIMKCVTVQGIDAGVGLPKGETNSLTGVDTTLCTHATNMSTSCTRRVLPA